jgi:hypothetical protein
VSRNQREGRYLGCAQGHHLRMPRQRKYLSATLARMIRLNRYAKRVAKCGIDLHDLPGWAIP